MLRCVVNVERCEGFIQAVFLINFVYDVLVKVVCSGLSLLCRCDNLARGAKACSHLRSDVSGGTNRE